MKKNILVVIGNSVNSVIAANTYAERLANEYNVQIVEERKQKKSTYDFYLKLIKKSSLAVFLDICLLRIYQKLFKKQQNQLKKYTAYEIIDDINSPHFLKLYHSLKPEYIVLSGCSIIKVNRLMDFDCPVLNLHNAITPRYRNAGNVWPLYEENFHLVGSTVHLVDEGVDTGERISIFRMDLQDSRLSMENIFNKTFEEGANLLVDYVLEGKKIIPEDCRNLPSKYYSLAGLSIFLKARLNYGKYLKLTNKKSNYKL